MSDRYFERPVVPPDASVDLRVRILGPLEVEGVSLADLGSKKQRTLLRVLALGRGNPISVDRVIDCLWPDHQPGRPSDQISVLVSRLRSVLGSDRVLRIDAGYALQGVWIDLVAMEALAAECERRLRDNQPALAATAATAALALVRGPLISDEPDAAWADLDRLSAERAIALLRIMKSEAALAIGDFSSASRSAEEALDADPYDEHALRLLMSAHARAGRPASALATYERVRLQLLEDLGTEPAQATQSMRLSVLQGKEQATLPSQPTDLRPQPSVPLPGRTREIQELDRAYARAGGSVEIIVVEGEAGIGKTRLVRTWTRSATAKGIAVSWGTCDPLGAALPLQALLDALHGYLSEAGAEDAELLRCSAGPVLGPLIGGTEDEAAAPLDPLSAPALLFAAMLDIYCSIGRGRPAVLVLDDVHIADPSTLAWLGFAARRHDAGSLLIVVTRRPEGHLDLYGTETIHVGPLGLDAAVAIVGPDRAQDLLERSGGHALFLVELGRSQGSDLPGSIVESVARRTERTGAAEPTLRSAAVLGPHIDLDLLAAVVNRPAVDLLEHLEEGEKHGLLQEQGTDFVFHHELVRDALIAGTGAARRALIHRDAARVLAERKRDRDPLLLAIHARQGGEQGLAAAALVEAAGVAASRFDHSEAERLLDESISLDPTATGFVARARVRLTTGAYQGAIDDAEAAVSLDAGAAALEIAGWAAYYRRDFPSARAFAEQAAFACAAGDPVRARALALTGRIDHADGNLDDAQMRLEESIRDSESGPGVGGIWLAWVLADRGELERIAPILEIAEHDRKVSVHPFGAAHRALVSAYTAGLEGRIAQSLALLDELDAEVERRQVRHFVGRSLNYRAWLLRNVMAVSEADDLNVAAAHIAREEGLLEAQTHASLDLADGDIRRGDIATAADALTRADELSEMKYAFVWHARLRHDLLSARLSMADGRYEEADYLACEVVRNASRLRLPRYVTLGQLVSAAARCASGRAVDLDVVGSLLVALDRLAGPESWWITAGLARACDVAPWWSEAEKRVARLASAAGPYAQSFTRQAGTVLDRMRTERRSD